MFTPLKLNRLLFILGTFLYINSAAAENPQWEPWQSLFNGKDYSGWTPKITGQKLGVNYLDTFRIKDGMMQIRYDKYTRFDNDFGHLFYKEPFENYHLRLDYRFSGDQTPGAPEWAFRNAGVMFHAQSPASMRLDQAFPVCVELQTLGGNGKDPRSTGNLCTPGSHVHMEGKLETQHCINSSSPTFHGDQWVSLELIVLPDNIQHLINGKVVFEYNKPVLDGADDDAKAMLKSGLPLEMKNGYIALQAEGHNVDYRNIEIRRLKTN